ncbi:MAG: c-type cytochrome [Syntrophales bacterium]
MKKFLISTIIFALGGMFLLLGNAGADDYSAGQTLFKKNCQFCHNLKGDDNYPSAYYRQFRPKDFADHDSWKGVDGQKIEQVIKKGKGVMPAINLKPEDTKAIIDYMTHVLKN